MIPGAVWPQGLVSLCTSVGFERAAYYGLQSILALYLADILLDDRRVAGIWLLAELGSISGARGVALASVVTGLFVSLAAIAPVTGAILADRAIGQHRAVLTGGSMMAAGHGLLIVEAALLPALVTIALGSGLFKGPVAAQLSGLYRQTDPARAEGFRLFYIAINLAGLLAPLIIGTAGERAGWHFGFAIACLAMMIGLVIYGRRFAQPVDARLPAVPMRAPLSARAASDLVTIAVLGASIAMITVTNFQIGNAYLLWVDEGFTLALGDWRFPASWMIAADGLLSLIALTASGMFWARVERRHGSVDAVAKAMIGGLFVVGGTACLALAASIHGKTGVPVYWAPGVSAAQQFWPGECSARSDGDVRSGERAAISRNRHRRILSLDVRRRPCQHRAGQPCRRGFGGDLLGAPRSLRAHRRIGTDHRLASILGQRNPQPSVKLGSAQCQ